MKKIEVNPALIEALKKNPKLLHELPPRQFEELVAELLASFGWEINLAGNRDKSYDILGIKKDATDLESTYLVECKRYPPQKKVGVDVLRSLYFVKSHLNVANAALVTTSNFTKDAKSFGSGRLEIQLVDFERLVKWINQYDPPSAKVSHLAGMRFFSCFISYSHKDEEFVSYLVTRLRDNGVRVWFSPDNMLPGRKLNEEISNAIDSFDKLLVVLSEASLESDWVKTEIRRARLREIKDGSRVLFPISLVSFDRLRKWEYFDSDTGRDLSVELREYLIPDFSNWRNSAVFEGQFKKLLEGLKAAPRSV